MESVLTCREFVEFLADYLAGQLPPAEHARFRVHLARCPACANYAHSYRQAVRAGREALLCPGDRLPGEVPDELVRAILAARGQHE